MRPRHWTEHLAPGSRFVVEDLGAKGSLPAAWSALWARSPGAPVLYEVAPSGHLAGRSGVSGRWISASEIDDRTRDAATRLAALGVRHGDRVVWSARTSAQAVIAHVGLLRAGATVVPVSPSYTDRELAHIAGDVEPRLAVVEDPWRDFWQVRGKGGMTLVGMDLRPMDAARGEGHGSQRRHSGYGAPPQVAPRIDALSPGDPALIAYTSGTTGAPKGAVHTHHSLLCNSESIALAWRWNAGDRLVHSLPIFHGHGLFVALYTSLLVGSSVVLLPSFDVDAVLDATKEHKASLFFGVPTMYHRLAASGRAKELATLRLAVSGSAPLAASLHRHLQEDAGIDVLERYGMTETLMTLSNPYDAERRAGTVGFGFPGVEVEVEGEVRVQGPTLFAGYHRRPAASAECFDGPWFRTGDLAEIDDGYVRILGRSGDLVISGGYNVYPAEVEDVLLAHPLVGEVAVTGTPSDEWGEVVTAWIVPAHGGRPGGLSQSEISTYASERLARYKVPRIVHLVDSLPRNALGKVKRRELG